MNRNVVLCVCYNAIVLCVECDVNGVGLQLVREPDDVVLVRGGAGRLDCVVQGGGGEQADLSWRYNGLPLPHPSPLYALLANGSLLFTGLTRRSAAGTVDGLYECVARHRLGAIISRRAQVTTAGE